MKILCVNSVISEFGGVEIAALNLARGLADRGHDVRLLGSPDQKFALAAGARESGDRDRTGKVALHYRVFPRPYPLGTEAGAAMKALWHLRDLADPANERIFSEVADEVAPDAMILHNLTGIGLNIWRTIRKRRTPCIQVIHDLNLVCLNMARFRSGRQCSGLCTACRINKQFRFRFIGRAPNFAFVSPSRATLRATEKYAPLSNWRREVIHNPNDFLVKPRIWSGLDRPRLLYVGRLDAEKGLDPILRAAQAAHAVVPFDFDVLGAGSLEPKLRRAYAHADWLRFHGSVDQSTIADFMSRATVLVVPSLWLETVPGVAVHALFAGLPVLGSRIGGIPEHVEDGRTGRLLPPGDETAWTDEIVRVVRDPQQVAVWSAACPQAARKFEPGLAIDAYERLLHAMVTPTSSPRRPSN